MKMMVYYKNKTHIEVINGDSLLAWYADGKWHVYDRAIPIMNLIILEKIWNKVDKKWLKLRGIPKYKLDKS